MKKLISFTIITLLFVSSFTISVSARTGFYNKSCSVTSTVESFCTVTGHGLDDYANFKIKHTDSVRKLSAYKMEHMRNSITGYDIKRGTPYMGYFFIQDNKNAKVYQYPSRNGTYLNDLNNHTIFTGRITDYYPASYERPNTEQQFQSGSPWECLSPWNLKCVDYSSMIQFDIK